ncbi:MAG: family 10 glycosylhydrolase [Deltaproteobacteria bacterium]|jgi:uncharacterized lipoprotein YddW (UPF0748 family)|nr:family 10 glycosylhydrolase [Deltaproteobacteria bacterium]
MRSFAGVAVGLLLSVACADEGSAPDLGANDAAIPDSGTDSDVGFSDAGDGGITDTGRELLALSHARELRGVWVATVSNINFPSGAGLPAATQEAELRSLVALLAELGFNAIFFQVRPECDAFYPSALEPWSRYLSGTQGQDPGYDPLLVLLDAAHAQGLEVHAWLNPYRAKANRNSTAVAPHVAVTLAEHTRPYGTALWLDPGAAAVQDHLLLVIEDLLDRYALDGLHFDDYFYPYPIAGTPFPDDDTFFAYQTAGGALARDDWRRDNVNRMVQAVHQRVVARRPQARFGIAPFGIYRPGMPPGITGLDQYAEIYADPVKWMEEGWVDYLAPQLYWPTTQTRQAYGPLLGWWSALTAEGRSIFVGNYLSQLGTSAAWDLDEFREQVRLSRAAAPEGSRGNIFYSVAPILEDRAQVRDFFRDLYQQPAVPPPIGALASRRVAPPVVQKQGGVLDLAPAEGQEVRAYLVYGLEPTPTLLRVVPASAPQVTLPPGRYGVTALDPADVESLGVTVDWP